jgi:intein-encoded DNA endonuclease-like protein
MSGVQDKRLDPRIGFILGALIGDGSLSDKNTIEFQQKSKEWLEIVKNNFFILFGKESKISKIFGRNAFRLRIYSKEIFNLFKELTSKINEVVMNESEEFQRKFLQGIFDAEGSVEKYQNRIAFYNKDEKIVNLCKTLLEKNGILVNKLYVKKRSGVITLSFSGIEKLRIFYEKINFAHPEKKKKLEEKLKLN